MSPRHARNARPHAFRPHAPNPKAFSPFANGRGGGVGNADAVWVGPNQWRVFLYLKDGPRAILVDAPTAQYAIDKAWATLKAERVKEAGRP